MSDGSRLGSQSKTTQAPCKGAVEWMTASTHHGLPWTLENFTPPGPGGDGGGGWPQKEVGRPSGQMYPVDRAVAPELLVARKSTTWPSGTLNEAAQSPQLCSLSACQGPAQSTRAATAAIGWLPVTWACTHQALPWTLVQSAAKVEPDVVVELDVVGQCSTPDGWSNQHETACSPPAHVARKRTWWPGSTWNDAAHEPHSGWWAIAVHGPPVSMASTDCTEPEAPPDRTASTHHSLPPALSAKTMTSPCAGIGVLARREGATARSSAATRTIPKRPTM